MIGNIYKLYGICNIQFYNFLYIIIGETLGGWDIE